MNDLAETVRIEIPVSVQDNTSAGVQSATRNMSNFERSMKRTEQQLNRMDRAHHVRVDADDQASGTINRLSSATESLDGTAADVDISANDTASQIVDQVEDQVSALVYDNFSAERMKLLGYSLNDKMIVLPQYRTAYISLSCRELSDFNFSPGDTEGFVNYPLSIKNVILSVFFVETMNHIKVSIRTRGNFSANEFSAQHFNGGGHKNAAGGKLFCSLQEAIDLLESILPSYEKALRQ